MSKLLTLASSLKYDICSKSYGTKIALQGHKQRCHVIDTQHSEEPFCCDHCSKIFSRSDNLRCHVKLCHKIMVPNAKRKFKANKIQLVLLYARILVQTNFQII